MSHKNSRPSKSVAPYTIQKELKFIMEGAYYNGQYLNRLERLGYSQAEIDNKLESTFEEMFYVRRGFAFAILPDLT